MNTSSATVFAEHAGAKLGRLTRSLPGARVLMVVWGQGPAAVFTRASGQS